MLALAALATGESSVTTLVYNLITLKIASGMCLFYSVDVITFSMEVKQHAGSNESQMTADLSAMSLLGLICN